LRALIHTIVAPYADFGQVADRSCVVVQGEDIAIGGGSVTGLALVLHEFTTNAAKYGALSSPTGSVHLTWTQTEGDLLLTWMEHGGPRIEGPPKKEGFGSVLARRTIAGQFGGDLRYDWETKGLVIRVRFPLGHLV
jgi:two-component system CheB/CheR fusion protein